MHPFLRHFLGALVALAFLDVILLQVYTRWGLLAIPLFLLFFIVELWPDAPPQGPEELEERATDQEDQDS